jgi:hypothetical protein
MGVRIIINNAHVDDLFVKLRTEVTSHQLMRLIMK